VPKIYFYFDKFEDILCFLNRIRMKSIVIQLIMFFLTQIFFCVLIVLNQNNAYD